MKKLIGSLSAIAGVFLALAQPVSGNDDVHAHWRFDEGTGVEALDNNDKNPTQSKKAFKWTRGVNNSAIKLNWNTGLHIKNSKSLNPTSSMTIEAWIKPWNPKFSDTPYLVSKDGSYELKIGKNKTISFGLWLNGKKSIFESNPLEWTKNGKWTHIAATYDGSAVAIYINGVLNKTLPAKGNKKIAASSSDVYIGSNNEKHVLSSSMDDLVISSKVQTAREIADKAYKGMFNVARMQDRFTNFYEKNMKRKAKAIVPGTLWIDAEDFDNYGGWWMDTQFVPQMGSPYLIAAGMGKPVKNAKTTISIPEAATYKLWVRNKNWIAEGHTPGKFAVSVNGKKSKTTFGTAEQRAWVWQDGGTFKLNKGNTTLELEDLTGFYGRCDALILTKDMAFVPRQEQKDYRDERKRFVKTRPIIDAGHFDVVVVGAGVAGCNAAIAAARGGANVALVQDRPMVGGNNSAELGVPVFGGGSSGRGRESGLNEEIGRIHSFNYLTKWATGAELVIASEPNISVFLNSHVFKADTDANKKIKSVMSFNMIDNHLTRYSGDIFIDSTGDGWLGYYAGAEWMLGRESKEMFGESNAKPVADNITMSGSLFQNSILGYKAMDMGKPTPMVAPEWVYDLRPIKEGYLKRPKYENGYKGGNWWTENHGRNDDLWDPEFARDDLIRVSLSYYNWIKNHSPLAKKAKNYQLKFIPITNAKRETRRLVGDYVLIEQDLLETKLFPDRVGYFVWGIDVHHPLGIFSKGSPFDYHARFKPSSMPFRMLYSKDIPNMLMAGRHVSVSHVALGSARVQGTTGMMGQVVGTAAAMCIRKKTTPRGIYKNHMKTLQQLLLKDDLYIPQIPNEDMKDLAQSADVKVSSQKSLKDNAFNVINGLTRPVADDGELWITTPNQNMWISNPKQAMPQWLELNFDEKETVNSVYLTFDTNLKSRRYIGWELKKEERMPPNCVRDYKVQIETSSGWKTVADIKNNYMRRRIHRFPAEKVSKVRVLISATNGDKSARIFEVRAYNEDVSHKVAKKENWFQRLF